MKRTLAILLALVLALAMVLCACGDDNKTDANGTNQNADSDSSGSLTDAVADDSSAGADGVYFLSNDSEDTVSLGTPEKTLDPTTVYKTLKYKPDMFYGTYHIIGGEAAEENYKNDMAYFKFNEAASGGGGVEREMTVIPYKIESSLMPYTDSNGKTSKLSFMEAYFYSSKGDRVTKKFLFTVNNNKATGKMIALEEIDNIKYTDDYKGFVSYEKKGLTLNYQFAFSGTSLTLKKDGSELTLRTGFSSEAEQIYPRLVTSGYSYLAENSTPIDHIVSIDIYKTDDNDLHSFYITFNNDVNEEETSRYACAEINENGLFTFTVPYATETKTYQYVYFYVNNKSLILTDGNETHYYTYTADEFHAYKLGTVLGDDVDVEGLSADETKELIAVQNSILSDLEDAFAAKDIDAEIDKATGRVTLDSNILFANDSYELSADGKKSLDDFLDVYTSVVLSDKNKDSVASIIVEGHTDTNGTDDYNQKLSENRADAVAEYCISVQPDLKDKIETVGYAAKYPVYGEDGEVDMAASRRVVFKFKLETKK